MKEIIQKYVLKNAFDFQGKVNANVVLGAVLKENEALRKEVPKVKTEIEAAVKEVEKLTLPEIKLKLEKVAPELLLTEKEEEKIEGPLKPLPEAQMGKVAVRIAPSPSGMLHVGNTYGLALNYEYAKMYQGKFYVRIEDTDPDKIYPPAYEAIPEDCNWLTDNGVTKVVIQSSRLGMYYDYAEKLVLQDQAYVCTCPAEPWRELKKVAKACPCRTISVKENQKRYAKMFGEYAEGEAVLRLKTDIKDKNPAMRDFGIMRIAERVHPKTGKDSRVWPLMVFSVAIDDHEMGITHVLNGKEHADNAAKEKLIMDCFGWKHPVYKHWGRINFEDFAVSKSKTRLAIEEGKYLGWDDIRLPFLKALRRRGYQPEAFRRFATEIGLSLNDKTVTSEEFWKSINAFNKEIIEKKANRYFFIDNPLKIMLEKAPTEKVQMDLHPDFPNRGKRTLLVKGEFFVAESDVEKLNSTQLHRLMDYGNFIIKGKKYEYISESYDEFKSAPNKGLIIHWLPAEEKIAAEVLQEDGTIVKGWAELTLEKVKVGEIVQLERRYFARVDKKDKNKISLWYLHK